MDRDHAVDREGQRAREVDVRRPDACAAARSQDHQVKARRCRLNERAK